jgi:DNA primase
LHNPFSAVNFSPALIEQIRAANEIVDVVGAILPLKRAGGNFLALCPFHKEKTPSFNINPHKQIFHCFGCHKGGDVFSFLQEYEGLSFIEAVKRLAERAKIPLEHPSAHDQPNRFLKDTLLQIHEQLTQHWHSLLLHDPSAANARAYLAQRNVPPETIQLFRLGYAPDSWDDTVQWTRKKSFDPAVVEQAGLIIKREGASTHYDRFRGRLIFPICDEQARVIAFSGRTLLPGEKTAKYVNSPETPIFSKSKVFYGLDKSKRALLDANCAIICEGQLDLIACFRAGLRNVVAPQGTAFTTEHARILKRYVNEVILCFDSDAAGQSAPVRIFDSLLASGLAIRVAAIPAPHDPDSFFKQFGAQALHDLIHRAEGFFDYYLNRLCADSGTRSDKGRITILKSMAEALAKTGNRVLLDAYAQKTALRLEVTPESVRAEFKKLASGSPPVRTEPGQKSTPTPSEIPRPAPHEFWFLKLIFLNDDHLPWVAQHLQLDWIQHSEVRRLVSLRLDLAATNPDFPAGSILSSIHENSTRSLITEVLAEERPIPQPQQQLLDILTRLRNEAIDKKVAALLQRSVHPGISEEEQNKLLLEQSELRRLKKEPLKMRTSDSCGLK